MAKERAHCLTGVQATSSTLPPRWQCTLQSTCQPSSPQAEVTSQRLGQLEDLKREARSLGLLQMDDDEGDEDGYADDLEDDNSAELYGGIANGKATPVGRGAQGLPRYEEIL